MSAAIVAHPRRKAAIMLANKPSLAGLSLAQLEAERQKWEAACKGHGHDDSTIDALADFVGEIEWAMIAEPARTLPEVLIKLRMAASFMAPSYCDGTLDAELLRSTVRDLERLARGE